MEGLAGSEVTCRCCGGRSEILRKLFHASRYGYAGFGKRVEVHFDVGFRYTYVMCTVANALSALRRSSLRWISAPTILLTNLTDGQSECVYSARIQWRPLAGSIEHRWPGHNHLSPSRTGRCSYTQVQSRHWVRYCLIEEAARCRVAFLAPCIGLSILYFFTWHPNKSVSWICWAQEQPSSSTQR